MEAGIGTLEDIKILHAFSSQFLFYHLSGCVQFKIIYLRHIHVGYTNMYIYHSIASIREQVIVRTSFKVIMVLLLI